jgi:hypothetical protein
MWTTRTFCILLAMYRPANYDSSLEDSARNICQRPQFFDTPYLAKESRSARMNE